MSDAALLEAMLAVEAAWLRVLVSVGAAPPEAVVDPRALSVDAEMLARGAEAGGNPVIGLVQAVREQVDDPAAQWLHRGLTSQDVLDTAIMLCARDALRQIRDDLDGLVEQLARLAGEHRDTPMTARTLTQPAVVSTFGAKVAAWLRGVLDARDDMTELRLPVQVGGAAGTLSGLVELAGHTAAAAARTALGAELGLADSAPWHTERAPVTRIADCAVRASDAWGRIANDVLTLNRPEIGELVEGSGGGSSTMPGKANPILSTLLRRQALAAPQLAATLHLAAANQVDERADGAWHLEWHTLALLVRHTAVASSQARTLISRLRVDAERMASRVDELAEILHAERQVMADIAGHPRSEHDRGLIDDLIDQVLARASQSLGGGS